MGYTNIISRNQHSQNWKKVCTEGTNSPQFEVCENAKPLHITLKPVWCVA